MESIVMTEFKISCPNCQQHLLCNESYRGVQFPCPNCGATISVPPAAVPSPPPGLRMATTPPAMAAQREARPHIPPRPKVQTEPKGKSWLTTFLLAWFLGILGVDRFHNGRTGLGIGKLLTGGGCCLWNLIDILMLLFKKYQDAQGNYLRPAKRSHMVVALSVVGIAMLMSAILIGSVAQGMKSGLANIESAFGNPQVGNSHEGFDSPEAVFEAMKLNPTSPKLLPPEERPMTAYVQFMMTRLQVAMQTDETRKQEAEKEFTALVETYHLADKLEINTASTMEQVQAMAAEAFTNVDLVAFMGDVSSLGKKFSTEHVSVDEAPPVSMKDLKIQESQAKATVVHSDETEHPVDFVKSDGRWFLSMAKRLGTSGGDEDITESAFTRLSLIVTFDSEASAKRATAKQLLQGVTYDKSWPATLEPTESPLQAKLEFMVPISEDNDMTASENIEDTIKRLPGVKDVQYSFAVEAQAAMQQAANEMKAGHAHWETASPNLDQEKPDSNVSHQGGYGARLGMAESRPPADPGSSVEAERDDLFGLDKASVSAGDNITATFSSPLRSPQGQKHWITIIDAKRDDSSYGKWKYVPEGAKEITLSTPNKAGDYEVRLHSNYPEKPYHVVQRTRLKIETAASRSSEAALNFDHVTKGVVKDLSPGGHDGKIMGGAKIAKTSLPKRNAPEMTQVMNFDGNDSYVEMAADGSDDLNLLPITITFWMKTTANDRLSRGVVNKYFSGSHNGYQLYLKGGNLYAWYFGTSGRVHKGKGSDLNCGDMSDGRWHHVAFIVDDKSGGQLFVDGVLRDSCPWTGTPSATTTGEPLRLGTYPSRSSIDGDFIGQMSEVATWNEARTKEQIYEEMVKKLTGTEPGLAGYWKLDSVINGGLKFK